MGVNLKFNLGATRPKVNALKTKVIRNINNNTIKGLIDLKRNISNIQLRKSRWTINNRQFFISFSIFHYYKMKVGKHYYIFTNNILNYPRSSWLMHLILPKGLCWCVNIISKKMKRFQVKENNPQHIMVLPMKVVKKLQKNGTIWPIKHIFVWHIVYKQHVRFIW